MRGLLSRWVRRGSADPPVGGRYRLRLDDGTYAIKKVIAVDRAAIHVRMYSNRYAEAPTTVPEGLELIGLGPDFLERETRHEPLQVPLNLGIGHYPQSRASFHGTTGLAFLGVEPVTPDELEGYEIWREAGGGVFN